MSFPLNTVRVLSVRTVIDVLERRQLLAAAGVDASPGVSLLAPEVGIITEYVDDLHDHGGHATGKSHKLHRTGGSGHLTAGDTSGSGGNLNGGGTVVGDYDIVVNLTGSVSPDVQAAFDAAEAKWESILLGDLPQATVWDINDNVITVDDLYIDANIGWMDGVGGVLGSAGPRYFRNDSLLPITGLMNFDSADLSNMVNNGSLTNVIIHEMGHVLGIGTLWSPLGLLSGQWTSNPAFTGPQAVAQLQTFTGGPPSNVSVEDDGGSGTARAHWNEDGESGRHSFHNELMTGFIDSGSNPLSRMTAASLADMGYPEVNLDAADLYNLPGGNDYPKMSSLSATATADGVRLTGVNPTDGDGIANVGFWLESNGLPGLQAGTGNPDLLLGTDTSGAGGYTLNVDGSQLDDGPNAFYARPVDIFGAVGEVRSTTFDYVKDSRPPALTHAGFEFETSQTIVFEFDEVLGDVDPGDLVVMNLTTGQSVSASNMSLARSFPASGERLEFTFTTRLANGNYVATLPAGSVADAAGNAITGDASVSFFVLAGDTDRDRDVDFFDFLTVRANYGGTDKVFSDGDFDYDGDVDFFDFLTLRGNYNVTLPPPGGSLFADDGGDDRP